ncbi:hypothetical protein N657DRAFT_372242 [Parathielavia appendiculata]|uniref:Uncharacterized protein n=1 Tax=Parathielavia appendiculata TaxID=2587402 RepID=A0AAN6TPW3_9PEZI|nr:hypothetical protein N657DRAFT_372242 [Parathielavia appendiculata]
MLSAMAGQSRSEIIKRNPIGNGLDGFQASYRSVCSSKSIRYASDTLDQLDDEGLASCLRCVSSSKCHAEPCCRPSAACEGSPWHPSERPSATRALPRV